MYVVSSCNSIVILVLPSEKGNPGACVSRERAYGREVRAADGNTGLLKYWGWEPASARQGGFASGSTRGAPRALRTHVKAALTRVDVTTQLTERGGPDGAYERARGLRDLGRQPRGSDRLWQAAPPLEGEVSEFVGSAACQSCHEDIYGRWKETLMVNVLQDPKKRPDAILADFVTPHPLVTFTPSEVVFTFGSKWEQRSFTQIGDDYFVFPAQWDVQQKTWRPYFPKADTKWWAAHYPADPMQRPTGALCDGCHAVNYDITTKTVTEWNVGCEKCHGAGGWHVREPVKKTIINPAKLDHVRADDVCIQCHSQGQPRTNPIEGRYFDWPVGYQPGDRLSDVWMLEEHHLGQETFTHWPDGSAHKNRMQGNNYVQSLMYTKGVRCYACHDAHGTEYEADLWRPGNAVCLTCHPEGEPEP
jgi:predicted CXXCH cytochrome family protein